MKLNDADPSRKVYCTGNAFLDRDHRRPSSARVQALPAPPLSESESWPSSSVRDESGMAAASSGQADIALMQKPLPSVRLRYADIRRDHAQTPEAGGSDLHPGCSACATLGWCGKRGQPSHRTVFPARTRLAFTNEGSPAGLLSLQLQARPLHVIRCSSRIWLRLSAGATTPALSTQKVSARYRMNEV